MVLFVRGLLGWIHAKSQELWQEDFGLEVFNLLNIQDMNRRKQRVVG
jgi:hypothetical protein